MRHKKEYLTPGDWERLKESGVLEPKRMGGINCYFCESPVSETHTDRRGAILPYCTECGVYYQPKFVFDKGAIYVSVIPRVQNDTYSDTAEVSHLPTHEAQRFTKTPQKKDVRGQIIALFRQYRIMSTGHIQKQIDASRQSVNVVLNALIAEGVIIKPKRGLYQRIEKQFV